MSWENTIKKEYESYDGYWANKPELEKLYRAISEYLKHERPIRDSLQGDLEDEDFGDDFRKELLKLLEKIGGKLNL